MDESGLLFGREQSRQKQTSHTHSTNAQEFTSRRSWTIRQSVGIGDGEHIVLPIYT